MVDESAESTAEEVTGVGRCEPEIKKLVRGRWEDARS